MDNRKGMFAFNSSYIKKHKRIFAKCADHGQRIHRSRKYMNFPQTKITFKGSVWLFW